MLCSKTLAMITTTQIYYLKCLNDTLKFMVKFERHCWPMLIQHVQFFPHNKPILGRYFVSETNFSKTAINGIKFSRKIVQFHCQQTLSQQSNRLINLQNKYFISIWQHAVHIWFSTLKCFVCGIVATKDMPTIFFECYSKSDSLKSSICGCETFVFIDRYVDDA